MVSYLIPFKDIRCLIGYVWSGFIMLVDMYAFSEGQVLILIPSKGVYISSGVIGLTSNRINEVYLIAVIWKLNIKN